MIETNEMKFDKVDLTNIDFESIKATYPVVPEEEAEEVEDGFDVEFDDDEYTRGIKLGSYIAGIIAPILAIGIPVELAADMVINERTIAYNMEALKAKEKEEVLREELELD